MSEVARSVAATMLSSSSVAPTRSLSSWCGGLILPISRRVRAIASLSLLKLGEDAGRRLLALRLEHRRLEPGDGFEQHVGLGRAVAARIFGEEPAPARRDVERSLERGVMLGEAGLLRHLGCRRARAL